MSSAPMKIDEFIYSMNRPPLHIVPFVDTPELQAVTIINYIDQSMVTRDFFKMVETEKKNMRLSKVTQDTMLVTGQVVGEFSMCYTRTLHARRQIKKPSRGKVRKTRNKRKKAEEENPPVKKRRKQK